MIAPPPEAYALHRISDPSLASIREQAPALLPEDFLFRVQRPGPQSTGGPTMSLGPLTLKEAERPDIVHQHMFDDASAEHLPPVVTLVVQWPGRAPFCASAPRPAHARAWSLALLAHEISVLMRGWLQTQGQNAESQDSFLRAVYLVECREVATNVWQPVFSWTGVPVKREPGPGALPPPNSRRPQH